MNNDDGRNLIGPGQGKRAPDVGWLPEGETCKTCAWFRRCDEVLGVAMRMYGGTACDWFPSRFRKMEVKSPCETTT